MLLRLQDIERFNYGMTDVVLTRKRKTGLQYAEYFMYSKQEVRKLTMYGSTLYSPSVPAYVAWCEDCSGWLFFEGTLYSWIFPWLYKIFKNRFRKLSCFGAFSPRLFLTASCTWGIKHYQLYILLSQQNTLVVPAVYCTRAR